MYVSCGSNPALRTMWRPTFELQSDFSSASQAQRSLRGLGALTVGEFILVCSLVIKRHHNSMIAVKTLVFNLMLCHRNLLVMKE